MGWGGVYHCGPARPPPFPSPSLSLPTMRSLTLSLSFLALLGPAAAAANCKAIPSDPSFPAADVWKAALPNAKARGPQTIPTRPDYRLEAASVVDVKAAVDFARKHNVRLSLITSGHDGLARNDAPSGLLVGLEKLTGVRIETTFTPSPKGAAPISKPAPMPKLRKRATPQAVTFGAGMTTQAINDLIAKEGIYTNGAEHGEVSVAGGWAQCGGHGPLTPYVGLGVDDALEFQVVTADGQLRIANAVSEPDLFWALRGGCGSTFGVVVQATVRAHPSPKMAVTRFTLNATNPAGVAKATAVLHAAFPDLVKAGVGGYYNLFPGQLTGIFHTVGEQGTSAYSQKIWAPILAKLGGVDTVVKSTATATYAEFPSYKAYYDKTWGAADAHMKARRGLSKPDVYNWWSTPEPEAIPALARRHGPGEAAMLPVSGGRSDGASRLLDAAAVTDPRNADLIRKSMPGKGMLRGALLGGPGLHKPGPADTAVHPSWRSTIATLWVPGDGAGLAELAPKMGSYVNEGAWNASNWQDVFWGANYGRLEKVKEKVDPGFVFYVTPGVGADAWAGNGKGALCKAEGGQGRSGVVKGGFPPVGDNLNLKKGSKG
ncbi:FAD-binding domain-containing protein [Trichodelitschia bisporula]|uniref:FAD-binding domain-containing protein n=1 Tax=Trichodelitschia bisporula TaxID=703511 RepID=A0A6G1HUD5_9PEZI|nr:FAD-binding domain-containing protein [Trichodelitschia bisporula]